MTGPPLDGLPADWELPPRWTMHYTRMTGSTNDDAKRAVAAGCIELAVFLADEQTQGRGRQGRGWVSPPGANLLFSVILRRPLAPIYLTAMCSVSVAEAIEQLTGTMARVKWPNDVMLKDRKVCGVLTEVVARGRPPTTVVGIGLNVNVDPVTAGLPFTATSLAHACGRWFPRGAVLRAILDRLDSYLDLPDEAAPTYILERWEALLWGREQVVRVDDAGSSIEGKVLGLSTDGTLRIATRSGDVRRISIGDVWLAS